MGIILYMYYNSFTLNTPLIALPLVSPGILAQGIHCLLKFSYIKSMSLQENAKQLCVVHYDTAAYVGILLCVLSFPEHV